MITLDLHDQSPRTFHCLSPTSLLCPLPACPRPETLHSRGLVSVEIPSTFIRGLGTIAQHARGNRGSTTETGSSWPPAGQCSNSKTQSRVAFLQPHAVWLIGEWSGPVPGGAVKEISPRSCTPAPRPSSAPGGVWSSAPGEVPGQSRGTGLWYLRINQSLAWAASWERATTSNETVTFRQGWRVQGGAQLGAGG